jgi:hypothetical protein
MVLFLIFLIPISLTAIIINYYREGDKIVLPLLPFFYGIVVFLPSILLYTIVTGFIEPSYTRWGFYFHTLLKEHLFMFGIAFGWAVILRKTLYLPVGRNSFYKTLAFFGGYYSALNIYEYLERITHLDLYTVFLLPLLSLATVLIAALLLIQFVNLFGVVKYVSLAAVILFPFLITLVTVLYLRNLTVFSVIGTIIFIGAAGFLFFLQKDNVY